MKYAPMSRLIFPDKEEIETSVYSREPVNSESLLMTKCSECGGVNGHTNPFCSKLDLKATRADDLVTNQHAQRYRIEWRPDTPDGAIMYWSEQEGWGLRPEDATIYTEVERVQYRTSALPKHGIWVVLNEDYNPAGALNVHQLAAISTAIRETFEAGDPLTPKDIRGNPIWNPAWNLYSASPNSASDAVRRFITEVQRRLTEKTK